jgi:serine/threonine protein kinase
VRIIFFLFIPFRFSADMFSLGIILFEMCYPPFGTGMERIQTLRALREKGEIPSTFPSEQPFVNLKQVVLWLTQREPSLRPSAAELLQSHLLPPRVDTDSHYLKEITEVPLTLAMAFIPFAHSFSVFSCKQLIFRRYGVHSQKLPLPSSQRCFAAGTGSCFRCLSP